MPSLKIHWCERGVSHSGMLIQARVSYSCSICRSIAAICSMERSRIFQACHKAVSINVRPQAVRTTSTTKLAPNCCRTDIFNLYRGHSCCRTAVRATQHCSHNLIFWQLGASACVTVSSAIEICSGWIGILQLWQQVAHTFHRAASQWFRNRLAQYNTIQLRLHRDGNAEVFYRHEISQLCGVNSDLTAPAILFDQWTTCKARSFK